MAEEEGTSVLETPPVFIALVFVFFLVVTLGFEKILHYIKHHLQHKGKHGLVAAMDAMSSELMLMGFATLILLVFQRDINRICVQSKRYEGKNWLDHVHGCACCLANTRDVSPCYFIAKGCQSAEGVADCCLDIHTHDRVCADINPNPSRRLLGVGSAGPTDTEPRPKPTAPHRLPAQHTVYAVEKPEKELGEVDQVMCDGRVQVGWGQCHSSPTSRPAVGTLAMHQVHLMIFMMAVSHIVCSIIMIILSSWRTSSWTRWAGEDDRFVHMVRAHLSSSKDLMPAGSALEMVDLNKPAPAATDVEVSATAVGDDGLGLPAHRRFLDVPRPKHWKGRPREISAWWIPLEWFWCVVRQFQPNLVKQEEFNIMRAAFYYTHRISPQQAGAFTFMDYVSQSLEDDYSKVVGLGLPMWIFLIIFILLSAEIGWCIWIFIALGGLVLLVVNTKLVIITRYVTRGGCIHTLEPGIFWLNRPWMLLPVIKFLLFLCSFVFSNAVFFAMVFGRKSCFFSRTGFQGNQMLPWWALMVVTGVYLLVLSLNTMPLYCLVVQMGGDFKAHLIPHDLASHMTMAAHERDQARTPRRGLSRVLSKMVQHERESVMRQDRHSQSNLMAGAAHSHAASHS
eukprot:jgi/Botrbrau1/3870/Bobra.0183s0094.1